MAAEPAAASGIGLLLPPFHCHCCGVSKGHACQVLALSVCRKAIPLCCYSSVLSCAMLYCCTRLYCALLLCSACCTMLHDTARHNATLLRCAELSCAELCHTYCVIPITQSRAPPSVPCTLLCPQRDHDVRTHCSETLVSALAWLGSARAAKALGKVMFGCRQLWNSRKVSKTPREVSKTPRFLCGSR